MDMRKRFKLGFTAFVGTALLCAGFAQASSAALVVEDMSNGATAQNMAQSLAGPGVTISNVTYTGAPRAGGNFAGGNGSALIGFPSGILLGSGRVQSPPAADPCEKGVEGPNQCSENTGVNDRPGDADLSALAANETFDAAILEFDFVPQFGTVQFRYVFSSDEYNEYVNEGVNDVFGFFVNGENCALVPGTSQPVTIDTINLGSNSQFYRDNEGGAIDTEMDGLTTVLACDTSVNAGVPNHLKLAISDAGDDILDSNVFIQAGSLVSGTQISTSLSGGGQSGAHITVPLGTSVTDSATLSGANAGDAGGTVNYRVYSDAGCQTLLADAGTKTVTNGQVPDSDPVVFNQAGTFYWRAAYSGDNSTGNNPDTSACGTETVAVGGGGEPSSKIAFASTRSGNSDIYLMNDDGSAQTLLAGGPAFDSFPGFASGGGRLAFRSDRTGNGDIYVVHADGDPLFRMTTNAALSSAPAWAPAGKRIAFASRRTGNGDLYLINSAARTRITFDTFVDAEPSWSPDGLKIAFASNRTANGDIYVINPDGSGLTRLTTNPAQDSSPDWGPAGQRIVFASKRTGNGDIYLINGAARTRLTTNPAFDGEPVFLKDGRIAFRSNRTGNGDIYVMNADGTNQTRLTTSAAFDSAPDAP